MNLMLKGKIVKKFRTQADFSMRVKEDEVVISKVIRGRRNLSLERQQVWAEVLGCKVEDIFSADAKIMQNTNQKNNPAVTPQPAPKAGREKVLPAVISDLEARAEIGKEKYGVELHTDNGRDPLLDAYQEALDLVMYLKQALLEMESDNE